MVIVIRRDRDFEKKTWDALCTPFKGNDRAKDLDHCNISDLTWCLRKGFYNKLYPDMEERGPETYNNWIRGKMSEYVVSEKIFPNYVGQLAFEFEEMVKAHPDLVNHKHVIELKDSNNTYHFTDPRTEKYNSFDGYFLQLLYYLVITGFEVGHLLVKHSNSKQILDRLKWKKQHPLEEGDKIPLRAYEITLTKDDPLRETVANNLRFKAQMFIKAVKEKKCKVVAQDE